MSTESLGLYIKDKTHDQMAKIGQEAEDAAGKIISDAEIKASRIKDETLSRLKKEMDEKEKAELSLARIEGKKSVMQVRKSYLEKVSNEAVIRLRAMAENGDSDYVNALVRSAVEAISGLGGSEVLIAANSRDGVILRERLPAIVEAASEARHDKVVVKVEDKAIDVIGGIIARTQDGRQVFGNTLEARIDSTFKTLRGQLLSVLFEGE